MQPQPTQLINNFFSVNPFQDIQAMINPCVCAVYFTVEKQELILFKCEDHYNYKRQH